MKSVKNMPILKYIVTGFIGLAISSAYSESYCPVNGDDLDIDDSLTKIYYLPTTYADPDSVFQTLRSLRRADFLSGDGVVIEELASSNSYTGPGSSEYDGLALAIAEKVLEQKNASADTAIDPHVDNVINFYNNGITNRQAVDIYRAGTNSGISSQSQDLTVISAMKWAMSFVAKCEKPSSVSAHSCKKVLSKLKPILSPAAE
ncbi:hypothetical protein [Bacterioplanes sanyensis]|uniref:hypothetical protein n=1 Tax=Bacterioplanes sanyensis TaxID=1249553 RepID=UPI0012FDF941|nr:hypothetical protein [Bacterioplanes sanyensis]